MKAFLKLFLSLIACVSMFVFTNFGAANAEVNAKYSISGDQALSNLEKQAQEGDAEAQYKLGIIYLTGNGVTADKNKAIKLIRQAAQQKMDKAQVLVAASYAIPNLFDVKVGPQDLAACRFILNKTGVVIKDKKVSGIKDKFAAKMLAYLDLLGMDGVKRDEKQINAGKENAAAIFEKLEISPDDYKVPEGTTFRQIFEKGLEQAYGLEIRDGKVVSFDDDNYSAK